MAENPVAPKAGLVGGMNAPPAQPDPSLPVASGGRMLAAAARWGRGGRWPVANPSVAVLTGANAVLTGPEAKELGATARGRTGVLGVRASAVQIGPMGTAPFRIARSESALSAAPTVARRAHGVVSSAPASAPVAPLDAPSLARAARTSAHAGLSANNR